MEKRYIDIKELSGYLGISKNTIYSWVWKKKIPYNKLGRLEKFDLRAIENWMKKNAVTEPEL